MTGTTYLNDPWRSWMLDWWVNRSYQNVDELPKHRVLQEIVKHTIIRTEYLRLFDFLQFLIERDRQGRLRADVALVLIETQCAYRVIDNLIVPITSDEQALAVEQALAIASAAAAAGPIAHLRAASAALSKGDWAGCVQQSIHAVEGAAKSVEPSADTLGPALAKLQESIGLPPALRKAFGALYGLDERR